MVSVCLPFDALLQHLPSYLGFSHLGLGISLHGCSSKVQPLLLTLEEGYLLITTPPDLERGVAPLGPPAPMQPPLLGCGVAPLRYDLTFQVMLKNKQLKNKKKKKKEISHLPLQVYSIFPPYLLFQCPRATVTMQNILGNIKYYTFFFLSYSSCV